MPERFFITGTDTGVGKTVVSALLCAALDALYWKPIQTGTREGTDRDTVMRLAALPAARALPEIYKFAPPVSPHLAARRAGVRIDLRKIKLPRSASALRGGASHHDHHITSGNALIVEGAGGVFVPINDRQFMSDLMAHLGLPVLLVARTALGTINHTLLSLAALRAARLDIRGVVMVGPKNDENRKAIERYGHARVIGLLPPLARLSRAGLLRAFRANFDRRTFPS